MKFLTSALLVMSFMIFTSCSHFSGHHGKKDCCAKKADKSECKDGACDMKKECKSKSCDLEKKKEKAKS